MHLNADAFDFPSSPIPAIEISLAPHEERYSDDSYTAFLPATLLSDDDDDALACGLDPYRPTHLSPPPPPPNVRKLSPLCPPSSAAAQRGLERDRFEALLRSSRERNVPTGSRRSLDLRKEIALKAHKSKQAERRALFLSKVDAPPSPSAISIPKTPPESPAIFHYSLPSPGLISPLALFESLCLDDDLGSEDDAIKKSRQTWVEQVDFRLPKKEMKKDEVSSLVRDQIIISDSSVGRVKSNTTTSRRMKPLPSLEQISARLNSQAIIAVEQKISSNGPTRLPAFLRSSQDKALPPRPQDHVSVDPEARKRFALLPIGVRSHSPPNHIQANSEIAPAPAPAPPVKPIYHLAAPTPRTYPPISPVSPQLPDLQITTTVIPRISSSSPVQLTEANLLALNNRERTARDMLSTIRRRTVLVAGRSSNHPRSLSNDHRSADAHVGQDDEEDGDEEDEEKKGRRWSAPAEMQKKERTGFMHPVLALPGGF